MAKSDVTLSDRGGLIYSVWNPILILKRKASVPLIDTSHNPAVLPGSRKQNSKERMFLNEHLKSAMLEEGLLKRKPWQEDIAV